MRRTGDVMPISISSVDIISYHFHVIQFRPWSSFALDWTRVRLPCSVRTNGMVYLYVIRYHSLVCFTTSASEDLGFGIQDGCYSSWMRMRYGCGDAEDEDGVYKVQNEVVRPHIGRSGRRLSSSFTTETQFLFSFPVTRLHTW